MGEGVEFGERCAFCGELADCRNDNDTPVCVECLIDTLEPPLADREARAHVEENDE